MIQCSLINLFDLGFSKCPLPTNGGESGHSCQLAE